MQSVKLRVSLSEGNLAKISCAELFRYTAEAIKNDGRYYYSVGGVTIEISELEFNRVVINPKLYYFSTALWLHLQIQGKKKELSIT